MKIALVTTTINVPTVLSYYHALASSLVDYEFRSFVAGDRKTPPEAKEFCDGLENCVYLSEIDQQKWKCSDLIGWSTIGRRSIAILEALYWGADIIVTCDDDNLPMSRSYFSDFTNTLSAFGGYGKGFVAQSTFTGIQVSSPERWFDVGQLLIPKAPHRGFPRQMPSPVWQAEPAVSAGIGVAAGICLGDPDIDAVERTANRPVVHNVSELLRAGIAVKPGTQTVFNSQNTAFLRDLAPCFLMVPQFQRYDDIFASLISQRVMRDKGYAVHFGKPFVWQQRNQHDLLKDLGAEMFGQTYIREFADWLGDIAFKPNQSTLDMVEMIYATMDMPWIPAGVQELGQAWIDDCRSVL